MNLFLHWLASTPDFAVPYALAALGLIVCERAGVLALGAEGLMLVGALAGVGAQLAFGNSALSLLAAALAAGGVSLPLAPHAHLGARHPGVMRPAPGVLFLERTPHPRA